jgi:SAM-dependent methyltransferase
MLTARQIMRPLSECLREDDTLQVGSQRLLALARVPILTADDQLRGSLKNGYVIRATAEGRDPTTRIAKVVPHFNAHDASVSADDSTDRIRQVMDAEGVDQVLVKDGETLVGVVATEDIETYEYEAPDGLPLPPPELIRLIGPFPRRKMSERFYRDGAALAEQIRHLLGKHGTDVAGLGAILDFGCGSGRLIRHWRGRGPKLFGSDYNPALVEWCRANLPFAEFVTNGFAPPLPLGDDTFDFIYSLSVFTHQPPDLQIPWIEELHRVIKPRGLILLSLYGAVHARRDLGAPDQERFFAGELVVTGASEPGVNTCLAYHPESYIKETFTRGFDILDLLQRPAADEGQDFLLLRKQD